MGMRLRHGRHSNALLHLGWTSMPASTTCNLTALTAPEIAMARADRPGHRSRIVIVGAGFAGLSLAKALAGTSFDITLIDRHNYHLFQPLLYQVATAGL